jgi:hypothetical protein
MPSGSLSNSNLTITSAYGFTGNISFSAFPPSNWNVTFSPASTVIAQGGSNKSVISVASSSTAQTGTYSITISGSSGTINHTTSLLVTISPRITNAITGFNLVNGGSGYTTPTVILTGGGGSGAAATARVSNGVVLDLVLTNAGTGYTSAPTVIIRDPSPRAQGASATAVMAG